MANKDDDRVENEVMTVSDIDDIVEISKALSSPTRVKILREMFEEENSVKQLAKKVRRTSPNISTQLKELTRAGLIDARVESDGHGLKRLSRAKVKRIVILLDPQEIEKNKK